MERSNSLLSWDQQSAGPTWGRKWPQRLAPVHPDVQAGLKGHMAKPRSPESCSIIRQLPSIFAGLHRRPTHSSQIYEPPPRTGTSPPAVTRTACLSVWFMVPGPSISPKIPDGTVASEEGCRENLSCCFASHSAASLSSWLRVLLCTNSRLSDPQDISLHVSLHVRRTGDVKHAAGVCSHAEAV